MEDIGNISDGYHTFNELYEHRHSLFSVLCMLLDGWKSKYHDDGSFLEGWFIAGVKLPTGMVTYHLPDRLYDKFPAKELERAPVWDGHTPNDVVERLYKFWECPYKVEVVLTPKD